MFPDQIGKYRTIHIKDKNGDTIKKECLGACETQLYSVLVTNTNYPTRAAFKHTTHFCTVVKKLLNSCDTRNISLAIEYGQLCNTIMELKVTIFYILYSFVTQ